MQPVAISSYIFFGTSLRFLQDASVGMPVHQEGFILFNIDGFLSNLDRIGTPVTKRAATELMELRTKLSATPDDYRLTEEEATQLREITTNLRRTLVAETSGIVSYSVTEKRYEANKLLRNVRGLMAPSVFDSLPDIAKLDFDEAGKCIAFERPTAAAFHLLRGTESMLRRFYCNHVKRNRVDPLMWGNMVESLRKRRHPPAIALLDNLDNIRRSYRNPTQHPEKIYDIQEVQDLFGLCVDVVTRMAGAKSKAST